MFLMLSRAVVVAVLCVVQAKTVESSLAALIAGAKSSPPPPPPPPSLSPPPSSPPAEPPSPSPVLADKDGSYFYTDCAGSKHLRIQALDRHNVQCPRTAVLTGFIFASAACTSDAYRYDYKCEDDNVGGRLAIDYTPCNTAVGRTANVLDRHHIQCDGNMALSGFHFGVFNCKDGNMQYEYTCQPTSHTAAETKLTSDCFPMVRKGIEWLDHHHLQCAPGSVLKGFNLRKGSCSKTEMQFEYSCAS